jgi:type I restriction enzyme, S subunit
MTWPIRKFEELAADDQYAIVGGAFGSKLTAKDYVPEGVPVIRGANMSSGRYLGLNDFVFVTEDKKSKDLRSNLAAPLDLVFTQRGTLGQVAIVPTEAPYSEFVVSQSQMKATLNPKHADRDFYYYFFSSKEVVGRILNMTSSSGVPHINLGALRNFEVPVPPLQTQKRIASILSVYDDLIENNRRRIELLEEAARLLYREWFVHFRFPGHEHVQIVDGVPKGWAISTLEDLLVLQRGFDLPTSDRKNGDVPVYGSTGIVGYHDTAKVGRLSQAG